LEGHQAGLPMKFPEKHFGKTQGAFTNSARKLRGSFPALGRWSLIDSNTRGLPFIGILTHFLYRWKTHGWTRPWAGGTTWMPTASSKQSAVRNCRLWFGIPCVPPYRHGRDCGEKDLALQQLETGLRPPAASVALSYGALKLLPFWDPLRVDPRFEKIVDSFAPKGPSK